jgi:hypothetical protein
MDVTRKFPSLNQQTRGVGDKEKARLSGFKVLWKLTFGNWNLEIKLLLVSRSPRLHAVSAGRLVSLSFEAGCSSPVPHPFFIAFNNNPIRIQ